MTKTSCTAGARRQCIGSVWTIAAEKLPFTMVYSGNLSIHAYRMTSPDYLARLELFTTAHQLPPD
ncbi:hypothetical protein BDZ89DRAFT_1066300 [Hymenopellis radicata]|nr:hypothetical protein BDZ89DRAFT_1066300 [Hymenopellis radicata]